MLSKKILSSLLFLAAILCVPHFVHAAAYNASDVLGHLDAAGAISFTQNSSNDKPGNVGFNNPTGVALDAIDHRLFVADLSDNRVVVYNLDSSNNVSSRIQAYVIGQPDFFTSTSGNTAAKMNFPTDVAYDAANKRLYVTDGLNHRVLVFDVTPGTLATGMNASYVIGQTGFGSNTSGTSSSTLNLPEGLAFDATNNRLFVADRFNNRVLIFNTANLATGMPASYVLGQTDFISHITGITSSTLSNTTPTVGYDPNNSRLFVMDSGNNRVLVWNVASGTIVNGMGAAFVLGQSVFTTASSSPRNSSTMSAPAAAIYDTGTDRVFISDNGNKRILVFSVASGTLANGEAASFVLGQSVFTTATSTTSASGISAANDGVYDPSTGHLFVGVGGNRVLLWNAASGTLSNGEAAADVLGQLDASGNPSFTKSGANDIPNTHAVDIRGDQAYSALDRVHHRLFVADYFNNRILVYKLDASNNLVHHYADNVIGQADLDSNVAATTQSSVSQSEAMAYDPVNDRLFVSDVGNERVLIFDTSNLSNGMNASYVLGEPDFTTGTGGLTSSTIGFGEGIAYDQINSRLFVVDNTNNRILIWNVAPGTIVNGMGAAFVLGQNLFTTASSSVSSSTFAVGRDAVGVAYDQVGQRLFASDNGGNRVLVWDVPVGGVSNGMPASHVLGQSSFTVTTSGTTSSTLNNPGSVVYDASTTQLFVTDQSNNRVLVFNVATSTLVDGEPASFVLGQSDFTSTASGAAQSTFGTQPDGLGDYDPVNHRMYVGDGNNNRYLIFDFIRLTGATGPMVATKGSGYTGGSFCATASSQGTVSCSASGTLPPGLTLDTSTGILTGTPTTAGNYAFTIIATDTVSGIGSMSDQKTYNLAVIDPASSNIIGVTSGGGGGGSSGSPVVTPPTTPTPSSTPATPSSTPSAPSTPSSPEASALQAQIQVLLTKIAELKAQLGIPTGTGAGSGTPTPGLTLQFTRNLTLGSTGDDVKALQQLLADQASGPAAVTLKAHGTTHLFGPLTKAALAEWQKAHNISPASGFFGPVTRAAVNGAH